MAAQGTRRNRTPRRRKSRDCWHLGCILPKSASNNRADRGLERENVILGYSSSGLLGSVQPVTERLERLQQSGRIERLQQLGRLSEDMERMLGL